MKKILFLLCALVCCTSLYAQKSDWAQYSRYEAANREIAFEPVAVFMGNSITDIWYQQHPAFFDENHYLGRGIGGQVTSQMLCRFRNDVIELKPQCVVILAGINNIAKNNGDITIENIFRNFVSMCELAKANGIEVVLCSTLPCDRIVWRPEVKPADLVRQLNAMLRDYAAKNELVYVDYHSALTNETGGLSEELSADGCHPTMKCYERMEKMVKEGIEKALKQSGK